MSIRQSNTDRTASDLKPDAMKSGPEQLGDTAKKAGDSIMSVVPGQEKARDNFTDNAASHSVTHDRGRSGDAPAEGGITGSIKQTMDQAASYVQPEKSKTQETRDTLTPGHHSDVKSDGKGVIAQMGDAVVGAKDAVVEALRGGHSGQQPARDL